MLLICPSCTVTLDNPNKCTACGSTPPREFQIERFIDLMNRLASEQLMTPLASSFRQVTYPIGPNELSRLAGGYFGVGYAIRLAEEAFNGIYRFDPESVDHPQPIRQILDAVESDEWRVIKLSECFHAIISHPDEDWSHRQTAKYQIVDDRAVALALEAMIDSNLAGDKQMFQSMGVRKSHARVLVTTNILAGYYFRVAEEIVGAV